MDGLGADLGGALLERRPRRAGGAERADVDGLGTDYRMGRLLAGVAVAHGRAGGNLTRDGLDRAYRAHSALTSVRPYVAFDLSGDLTVWGQGGWGHGEMALSESIVRTEGMEQAGAYRAGSGLSMLAAGVRGGLETGILLTREELCRLTLNLLAHLQEIESAGE